MFNHYAIESMSKYKTGVWLWLPQAVISYPLPGMKLVFQVRVISNCTFAPNFLIAAYGKGFSNSPLNLQTGKGPGKSRETQLE